MLATFTYDDLGRRTALTRGNGAVTSYGYDPVSRLASLTENFAGTANDQSSTFAYTPASQIASLTRTNTAYAWTGHGSGTIATTVNGLNQIAFTTGVPTGTINHDARGNLTSDPTTGRSYTYASENMLTAASGGVSLYYDPALRLVEYDTTISTRLRLRRRRDRCRDRQPRRRHPPPLCPRRWRG